MPITVDHAVVNVLLRMDEAVARFRALGFTLTERGHHSLGSINHLAMFGSDYLELVGIEPGATKIRREVADSPLGLNGLVLRTADARRLHDSLSSAGIPVLPPVDFDRPVRFEGRDERAAFTTVRIEPDWLAGGRVYFCEHKTPHLVWQPDAPGHENGAVALAGFTIVVEAPADEAARYARLFGIDALRQSDDEACFMLEEFCLRLCTVERYRERFGDFASRAAGGACGDEAARRPAFMGALEIRVRSLDEARRCLERPAARDLQWRALDDRLTVAAASAYDCPIDFVA